MKKLVLIGVAVLLSSCANNIQIRQERISEPQPGVGYIAGGFLNSYRESFARMALELHNSASNEAYLIELQQPKNHIDIELFPFKAGTYKISNLVEMGGIGDVGQRLPIEDSALAEPFHVKENEIVYIGHFDGKSTNEIASVGFIGTVGWVDTNSGYGFRFENKSVTEVAAQLEVMYPDYRSLDITRAFPLEDASQEGGR